MMKLKEHRVIVTGGCGFIGSHMAERLADLGLEVIIADNLERGELRNIESFKGKVTFKNVDLRDQEAINELLQEDDLVFHLAFKVGGIPYTGAPTYFSEIWTDGVRINTNVIDACLMQGVSRLLFTSSACVYPGHLQTKGQPPLREDQILPAMPDDAYGWCKLVGELQCKWYHENYGLESVIVRPFNVIGEREYLDRTLGHFVPVMARKVLEWPDQPFTVHGDGSKIRSFVYVADVIDMMILAMEKISDASAYNVGTNEHTSVKEVVDKIIALSGVDVQPEYLLDYPVTGVERRVPDLTRTFNILDWSPKYSLDYGLEQTFNWVEKVLAIGPDS